MKSGEKEIYNVLGFLLDLANTDLETMEDGDIVSLLFNYARKLGQLEMIRSIVSSDRYDSMMDGLTTQEKTVNTRRQGLLKIRKHLHGLLDKIVNPSDQPIIKRILSQEIRIDPGDGKFIFRMEPVKFDRKKLVWNEEKILIDLIFIAAIKKLGLQPEKIQRCKKCSNYFLQKTKRSKYCSGKCSNVVRQAEYVYGKKNA